MTKTGQGISGARSAVPGSVASTLGDIVFDERQIADAVSRIASEVCRDYGGEPLVLIGILKGAALFTADLMRALADYPLTVDFMVLSSYGNERKSGGQVRLLKDLDYNPAGRHVLLAEDIVDEGFTLSYLLNNMRSRHATSVRSCALLDKPFHRKVDVNADYIGMSAPDAFLVGYGLDFQERFRNLPHIRRLLDPVG